MEYLALAHRHTVGDGLAAIGVSKTGLRGTHEARHAYAIRKAATPIIDNFYNHYREILN